MSVFTVFKKAQSAFLGLERRRKSEPVPKSNIFGALFEYFGPVFAKNDLFFAKIEKN